MPHFHEVRFPLDIAYGVSGGPEFSTDIVITQSGHEQRQANWSQARAVYNVAHGVRSKAQMDELIAFFRARKGRAYGFRFKDWLDYQASEQIIGEGDGVTTHFQLLKTYSSGAEAVTRMITRPVENSVDIYVDSLLQDGGFSVDIATGIVTFDVAPTAETIIAADFEFDVPVRFDTDRLSATMEDYGLHSWQDIPLVELREGNYQVA